MTREKVPSIKAFNVNFLKESKKEIREGSLWFFVIVLIIISLIVTILKR